MTAENGPNPSRTPFLAAIDARLVSGRYGGDSSYWTALIFGFREIAADIPLLFVSNASRPQNIPWSETWRWEVVSAPSSRIWSWFSFPRAAKKLGARVIHTQYNLSPIAGRRGLTTIHDVSFFIGPEWFSKKDRFLLSRFVPASAKRSAKVITVSQTSRSEIEKFIPAAKGKVAVTPLASPPWVKPMDRKQATELARQKWGLDGPFLVTVGNQWARKNQQLAIDAVNLLPASLPHCLALAGKPADLPTSARIKQLGFVEGTDIGILYSAADLMIFPSLHEGFGLPILEAFSCGCPVICGAGGAMPEVAAGAACIPNSYSAPEWAGQIQELLNSSGTLSDMMTRGKMRLKDFSWVETASQTLRLYQEVAR